MDFFSNVVAVFLVLLFGFLLGTVFSIAAIATMNMRRERARDKEVGQTMDELLELMRKEGNQKGAVLIKKVETKDEASSD